jgi:predicted N-formylglutamate amidohydrolase
MDKKPFEILNEGNAADIIIICDHASNYVPSEFDNLGLEPEQLNQHIGWDIGAADLTCRISKIINAAAIICGTSRLVVDTNRSPDDQGCIPEFSDNIIIPGNLNLTKSNRMKRIKKYFWPYHNAVSNVISKHRELSKYQNNIPLVFSIHTFTPIISLQKKTKRPWHAGVLWNRDPRVSIPLMRLLKAHSNDLVIGDNEPYSGKEFYYSLDFHAGNAGLPHCAIEVRQDLVSTSADRVYWADVISKSLLNILRTRNIFKLKYY